LRGPEKNRKKPPFFSGDFPGISRGIFRGFPGDFFRKKPGFSSIFTSFYRRVHCSAARVLEKTPKFPEKFPGISGIPENPRKKFPEIPGNSVRQVFGEIFPDFPDFRELQKTAILCNYVYLLHVYIKWHIKCCFYAKRVHALPPAKTS
jgi:hypothetical protein